MQPTKGAVPLVVVWRVTERCDLACLFCGYSRELRRPRRQVSTDAVLAFARALAEYASIAGREVLVSWLGGEPLLWAPLPVVGPALRQLGLRLGVTTNGARLDDALCTHLVEHYAQVTVSVDGLAAWHTQVRGAPGLWAQLETALRRLAELRTRRGAGPRLRANVVLMRSNLADFETLCEHLADWGVREITFNALGGLERGGAFYEREHLLPEHVRRLRASLPGLRGRLAARGLALQGGSLYLDRLEAQADGRAWPVADCGPGRHFLFVDEMGFVGPCSFTARSHGVHISELTDAAALRALPDRWRERFSTDRPDPCADCRSTQVFGKFADGYGG